MTTIFDAGTKFKSGIGLPECTRKGDYEAAIRDCRLTLLHPHHPTSHPHARKLPLACLVVGYRTRNQRPKRFAVIELCQMTQLVHDQVVLQMWRKEYNAIVEIKIAQTRATSPAGLLITYCNTADAKTVCAIELRYTLMHKRARRFFVFEVVR